MTRHLPLDVQYILRLSREPTLLSPGPLSTLQPPNEGDDEQGPAKYTSRRSYGPIINPAQRNSTPA